MMMALSKTMTGERLPAEVTGSDLVRQALEAIRKHLGMEAAFAHETGAMVIAEGIETVRENAPSRRWALKWVRVTCSPIQANYRMRATWWRENRSGLQVGSVAF
jgi:hypothetical protein